MPVSPKKWQPPPSVILSFARWLIKVVYYIKVLGLCLFIAAWTMLLFYCTERKSKEARKPPKA